MIIKKFNDWSHINEEASLRAPSASEEYWIKKGKDGKKVALYTHDDMDGIFCAIEMKKWLLKNGFEIVKYGVINYSEGWKYTTLDPKLINIVLDFANMPGDERDELVDYYLDHHGLFSEEDLDKYKSSPVKKLATSSAYEALCIVLGLPQDELVVSVIDMIDAAKYQDYGVSWQRLLDFNLSEIKNSDKKRLEFAAAFNQFLKRSDVKTLISVIDGCKDASIYSIFNTMKQVYGTHNLHTGYRKGQPKDFEEDSAWRLSTMQQRTRGKGAKKVYNTQQDFLNDLQIGGLIRLDGYVLIGDLTFVPTGVWANALRARTIIEKDFKDGLIPKEPKFILLQYGGTLQVCSYKKIPETQGLPTLKGGGVVNDLGKYMTGLLDNFKTHLGYYDPDTSIGQDEITVSGGHGGIGSISNIFGTCDVDPYKGFRFIDIFKNKIISDLSGVKLNMGLKWSEPSEGKGKEPEMDNKVISAENITKLDKYGKVIKTDENYEYQLVNKDGKPTTVSKEEFLKAGSTKAMKTDRKSLMTIDNTNMRVIAKFDSFKYKGQ
jgi:hypothetical protein